MGQLSNMKAEYDRLYGIGLLHLARRNYQKARTYLNLAARTLSDVISLSEGTIKETRKDYLFELICELKDISEQAESERTKEQLKMRLAERQSQRQSERNEDGFEVADIPDVSFDDVVGLTEVKKAVFSKVINPLKYADIYKTFKKKTGGGILLYGPAGTGKTMIAKAIAKETGASFYSIKTSDLLSKWFGESESNIKKLFEDARSKPRAVIFLDEVEALTKTRDRNNNHCLSGVISELLAQMQGFEGKDDNTVTVIAATNKPWEMDSAFLRPGRFDEKIYVPMPDKESREFMLKKRLTDIPVSDINYDYLVERTEGFSGADVDYLCEKAKEILINDIIANETREQKICMADFDGALLMVKSSVGISEEQRFREWAA